jgi:hypothetical protein
MTEFTFSTEDSTRLSILVNEIQTRLSEVAEIASKAGQKIDPAKMKFVPEGAGKVYYSGMHIEIIDMPDGTSGCVVWEHWPDPAAKWVCPCA